MVDLIWYLALGGFWGMLGEYNNYKCLVGVGNGFCAASDGAFGDGFFGCWL